MYDKALRASAIRLRQQGNTYAAITERFHIPKSTLSGWLRTARVSAAVQRRLVTRAQRIWARNITRYNQQRAQTALYAAQQLQQTAARTIGRLTLRELRLVGTALYWAEGKKNQRWLLNFSNADPRLVRLMMRFFREVCDVSESRFRARVHIHPHTTAKKAVTYWSQVTGIPPQQFWRTQTAVSRRSRFKRPPMTLPFGTLHISISGQHLTNTVNGWILGLGNGSGK